MRIFSFGLGSGCDQILVNDVARTGRGTSTIVKDNDPNLNGLVVTALANAMEPSFKEVRFGFNDNLSEPQELYRNIIIQTSKLMNNSVFEELKFTFQANPSEFGEALNLNFQKSDFVEVKGNAADNLVKMAANKEILDCGDMNVAKELSLKYQVLCDQTAIFGVMKQTDKVTGDL